MTNKIVLTYLVYLPVVILLTLSLVGAAGAALILMSAR